ncbi:MAG: ADP-forming succinate--CoA ligase subunit beta [bacterium]
MNIHEYQAKEILRNYGIRTPRGKMVISCQEATEAAMDLGGKAWVIKAQIHAGGRGKSGGILKAEGLEQVEQQASSLLGKRLVTPQTGPTGKLVRRLLVEEQVDIETELYAGVILDRSKGQAVLMASRSGGMEIEALALEHPEAIFREHLEPWGELPAYRARRVCFELGVRAETRTKLQETLQKLCRVFYQEDCTLAEINPLVITGSGDVLALDAKINLDDNAAFRHPAWADLRDPEEEDPLELEAARYGLNYVKMDGTIGCMVNGAGLAMATMDFIQEMGAKPANFLDVGGGVNENAVAEAFRILMLEPRVKVVLVNIFGGIVRGDVIARGIVSAASKMQIGVPLVVRLAGTHASEGKEILQKSGLSMRVAESMREAARIAADLGRD